MKTQVHEYQGGDKTSSGYLAVPDGDGAKSGHSRRTRGAGTRRSREAPR